MPAMSRGLLVCLAAVWLVIGISLIREKLRKKG